MVIFQSDSHEAQLTDNKAKDKLQPDWKDKANNKKDFSGTVSKDINDHNLADETGGHR